jgi:hypothetical protein
MNQVLEALQAARWREIYSWLTANSAEQLAVQLRQLGVSPEKISTTANLLIAMEETDPVEAPRSWKREDKAAFAALPRAIKEAIAHRETERDREVRRLQNATAEHKKEAERLRALLAPPAAAQQTNGASKESETHEQEDQTRRI